MRQGVAWKGELCEENLTAVDGRGDVLSVSLAGDTSAGRQLAESGFGKVGRGNRGIAAGEYCRGRVCGRGKGARNCPAGKVFKASNWRKGHWSKGGG